MNIIIKDNKLKKKIKLGDIVKFIKSGTSYIITRESNGFVARSFDGNANATGIYNSLEELIDSIKAHSIEHFSKDDYDLILMPKQA